MSDINNLGTFTSINAVWKKHPEGGKEGDYLFVNETKYRWNKYDRIWENAATVTESPARRTETVDGDLNVHNNLTVAGTIRAKGIESAEKGRFDSLDALKAKYTSPNVGDTAYVGSMLPYDIYVCKTDGKWEKGAGTFSPSVSVPEVTQTPGEAEGLVMSQKAVTALLTEYDVSAANGGRAYTLADAIAAVPAELRKSGLTIKFVDSTVNMYISYRCVSSGWTSDVLFWMDTQSGLGDGEFLPITLNKGYIDRTGAVKSSNSFKYSSPFFVESGKKVIINFTSPAVADIAVVSRTDEAGSFFTPLKTSISNSPTSMSYEYVPDTDGYFAICGQTTNGFPLTVRLISDVTMLRVKDIDNNNEGGKQRAASAENLLSVKRHEALSNEAIGLLDISPGVLVDYYINKSGVKINAGAKGLYECTEAIKLSKGDILSFVGSGEAALSCMALVNPDGGVISVISKYEGNDEVAKRYFADADCHVAISYRADKFHNIGIRTTEYQVLAHDIDNLTREFGKTTVSPSVVKGKFLSFKNVIDTSTHSLITEPIKLKNGDTMCVRCTQSSPQHDVAALCNDNGTPVKVIVPYDGTDFHIYKATSDCLVIVSYNYDYNSEIFIYPNTAVTWNGEDVFLKNGYEDKVFDFSTGSYSNGNSLWGCKTIPANGIEYIVANALVPNASSNTALITYVDKSGKVVGKVLPFKGATPGLTVERVSSVPFGTESIIFQNRTGDPISKTAFRLMRKKRAGYINDLQFDTMKDMVYSGAGGVLQVGNMLFKSLKTVPDIPMHTQPASNVPYLDYNRAFRQYKLIGSDKRVSEGLLDGLKGVEIDFSPEDTGFTRIIVGKDSKDGFFVYYAQSSYKGKAGNSMYNHIEYTTDFKTFKPIFTGFNDAKTDASCLRLRPYRNIRCSWVREMVDGSFLMKLQYYNDSMPATDTNGNTENNFLSSIFRLSADMSSIQICSGTDVDGLVTDVFGSHGVRNGKYGTHPAYDWGVSIVGNKALVGEYGSRVPSDDWGRVWYTEDCGKTWREVWQTRNHLTEGIDKPIAGAHTHGVFIDPYTDRLWIVVGEDNSNLFYSDDGFKSKDATSWHLVRINNQLCDRSMSYGQVANGIPFKDNIILGSDCVGIGALYRLNKLEDGTHSAMEIAHEITPYNYVGTKYCAGAVTRRDQNSPCLICVTRENSETTEEANDGLMKTHLGRVIASWDGVNFFEIWHDDTYGAHEVCINGEITTKNYAYCTREMTAWLCNNGDLVIKYSGRDYSYFAGKGYVAGYSNIAAKVRIFKNVANHII